MKNSIIKDLRKRKGYNAEKVADLLGVAPSTVYRYENGDISKIPDTVIRRLAEILGVSRLTLLNGADVGTLDAEIKADWIKEQLIRNNFTDREFDLIETYIDFILSQRGKEQ